MNILLLTDKTIDRGMLSEVQAHLEGLYSENCKINIRWVIEERDYTTYPKEVYWGGYEGIRQSHIREVCADVYKRHEENIDNVVFLINSDNWNLSGVWGWNMSAQFSGYGVQQVRFADVKNHSRERNINNTVGTLYHEFHHDHDGMIFVHTGQRIEPLVGVMNWDEEVTHGESPNWEYIRHKENQASLRAIAPLLRHALGERQKIYLRKKLGYLEQILGLYQQLLVLRRQLEARDRGDIPILENNNCTYGNSNHTCVATR